MRKGKGKQSKRKGKERAKGRAKGRVKATSKGPAPVVTTKEFESYLERMRLVVDQELAKALDVGANPRLKEAMAYLPSKGGKRLRPIMAMTAADAVAADKKARGNGMWKEAMPLGLALEIIHNFTLLHDDIMDGDDERRGVPTVHKVYSVPTAINAGDALFARAFEVLGRTRIHETGFRTLVDDLARMVRELGEGQEWDIEFEHRTDVTEDEYLRMVERKTGLMFQNAAKGGALVAGGTRKQVSALHEYGRLIGIGFQIQDDYLDLTADPKKLKKPVGNDIKTGKQTIIIIHGKAHMDAPQRARLDKALGKRDAATDADVRDAIAALREAGSLDYARQRAFDHARMAEARLAVLPDSVPKEHLRKLIEFIVLREF